MKNLKKVLLALLIIAGFNSISAQDARNPWEIDFGANAVVFYPMGGTPQKPNFGDYLDGLFKVTKHYNYYSVPERFHIGRYIKKGFSVGMSLSINKIKKWHGVTGISPELNYFGFDTDVRYDLKDKLGNLNFIKNVEIDPYISTGVGFTAVSSYHHNGSFNLGGGINFWIGNRTNNIGVQIQTIGKLRLRGSVGSYWHHSLGIVFRFGNTDSDGDGVKDKEDKCPEVAGLPEFGGCPDMDGDGIIDSADKCPNVAGPKKLKGCPDTDGDGIVDKDDKCPNVTGPTANRGCPWPDTDRDGILDKDDACPSVAGSVANKGCPMLDTDGDGVGNKIDKCVDVVGPASNNGCPVKVKLKTKTEHVFGTAILFVDSHSSFINGVSAKLDIIIVEMKYFKKAKFMIIGYTDNRGTERYNIWLSKKRANAVKKYLVDHGVEANRLTADGYGEANPIAPNECF